MQPPLLSRALFLYFIYSRQRGTGLGCPQMIFSMTYPRDEVQVICLSPASHAAFKSRSTACELLQ
jgi:hypothetical protein